VCGWGSGGVMVSGCVLCDYGEDGECKYFGVVVSVPTYMIMPNSGIHLILSECKTSKETSALKEILYGVDGYLISDADFNGMFHQQNANL
jgi:hypothetical protein